MLHQMICSSSTCDRDVPYIIFFVTFTIRMTLVANRNEAMFVPMHSCSYVTNSSRILKAETLFHHDCLLAYPLMFAPAFVAGSHFIRYDNLKKGSIVMVRRGRFPGWNLSYGSWSSSYCELNMIFEPLDILASLSLLVWDPEGSHLMIPSYD